MWEWFYCTHMLSYVLVMMIVNQSAMDYGICCRLHFQFLGFVFCKKAQMSEIQMPAELRLKVTVMLSIPDRSTEQILMSIILNQFVSNPY